MRTRLRWLMALGLVAATAAGWARARRRRRKRRSRWWWCGRRRHRRRKRWWGRRHGGRGQRYGLVARSTRDARRDRRARGGDGARPLPSRGRAINTCAATPGTSGGATYAWTLKAPEALLYDAQGHPAGTHGAGPTWTANDGSSVKGMKLQEAASPAGDAIARLLLRVTTRTGAGLLAPVSYVQRVYTTGGKAPAGGLRQHDGPDGGKPGAPPTAPTITSTRAAPMRHRTPVNPTPPDSPAPGRGSDGRRGRGFRRRRGRRGRGYDGRRGRGCDGRRAQVRRAPRARVRRAPRARARRAPRARARRAVAATGQAGALGRTRGRRRGREAGGAGSGRRRGYASRAHGGRHVPGRHVHLHHRRPHGRALRGGRIITGSRRAV